MVNVNELVVYSVSEAAISDIRTRYMALSVKGLDDKQGYEACKKARIEVKGYRVEVDKQRKVFKQDALEYGRMVDSKARQITDQLEAVEVHLKAQQDIIDNEKKRREEAVANERQEKIRYRTGEMMKYRAMDYISPEQFADMDDEDFSAMRAKWMDDYFIEQKKREEEKARLAKLEQERIEYEKSIKAQADENQSLREKMKPAEAPVDTVRIQQDAEKNITIPRVDSLVVGNEVKFDIINGEEFEYIRRSFNPIEVAWIEIYRLRKILCMGISSNKSSDMSVI